MTENEAYIFGSLVVQIKMGFASPEEIKEMIYEEVEDNEFGSEISENWVNAQIDQEFKKHQEASKHWTLPTDTDRLINAFDELCKNNIVALHNAGYTTSDGENEVVEVEVALRENDITSDGYCFYHEQDLATAIDPEEPSLYLAFQKVDNSDDAVTIEVGKKVVTVLKKHGFTVEWEEIPTTKILIPQFRWYKVYNEKARDLLDYSRVVKMLID